MICLSNSKHFQVTKNNNGANVKELLLTDVINRYRTLKTNKIYSLPIVILMPHSRCNCRCIMCDIWKGNNNVQQLNESDIEKLLSSLKKLIPDF